MARRTQQELLAHHQSKAQKLARQLAAQLDPQIAEVASIIRRIDKLRETNSDEELGDASASLSTFHERLVAETMQAHGVAKPQTLKQHTIGDDPFAKEL